MIIRMKRDYQVSYKYATLLKGNNYDVNTLPVEVRTAIKKLLSAGWAVEVQSKPTAVISVNHASQILEERQKQEDAKRAEMLDRQEVARQAVKTVIEEKPVLVPKKQEDTIQSVKPVVEEEKAPTRRGRRPRSGYAPEAYQEDENNSLNG